MQRRETNQRTWRLAAAAMLGASALAASALAGCGERAVTLRFEGLVKEEPARCGARYEGVGTTGTQMELDDFRLYVHDVRLVTASGEEVEVVLEQDGAWQHEDVVLLDFEDGRQSCLNGTPETNTQVRGTVAADGPFTGVRFRLGVPFELNHGDASTAPAPLSFTSMFWSWNGGYKFLRVDGRTTGMSDGFRVHLGSTGCEGDGRGDVTGCVQDNRAEVALDGMDPDESAIAVDLAALFSDSDLDEDEGGQPGCMGGLDDPDCEPIFHALGLAFGDNAPQSPQRFFSVR